MNERLVVPPGGFRLSSLTAPRVVEVVKPAQGEAITLDLSVKDTTTLDFSALVGEKLKLAHSGTKLIVEFDNHSTVTAEPFFDFSGRPFPYIAVEFSGGQGVHADQFAALLDETVGQSRRDDADVIPSSGANFVDTSVDVLPESLRPLGLLGQESHKSLFDGSPTGDGGANRHALLLTPVPVITFPSPGGAATQVFEGGLLASRGPGESGGSHAGQPSFPVTTRPGTISFTSPDGVQSVSLGGHVLTNAPQTFTDATGSLTASYTFDAATHKGTINYTSP